MSILSSSFYHNAEAIPAWLAMDWQIIRKTWPEDTDCFTGKSFLVLVKILDRKWMFGCLSLKSELLCVLLLVDSTTTINASQQRPQHIRALRFKLNRTDPHAHTRLVPIMPMMDKTWDGAHEKKKHNMWRPWRSLPESAESPESPNLTQ